MGSYKDFLGGLVVKNLHVMQEMLVQSLGSERSPGEGMATPPVFLPGESHGQRNLKSYSPEGCKESDMTERLTQTHTGQSQREEVPVLQGRDYRSPLHTVGASADSLAGLLNSSLVRL